MEGSGFASLYGATNPYDDFAECFASDVHCELLDRPQTLAVEAGGSPAAWLEPFWESPRSLRKRRFMECLMGPSETEQGPAALPA